MENNTCEICGNHGAKVTLSKLGSEYSSCKSCFQKRILPWDVLVSEVLSFGYKAMENIRATLGFYGKTHGELVLETEKHEEEHLRNLLISTEETNQHG